MYNLKDYIVEKFQITKDSIIPKGNIDITVDQFIDYLRNQYNFTDNNINEVKQYVIRELIEDRYGLKPGDYTLLICDKWKDNTDIAETVYNIENGEIRNLFGIQCSVFNGHTTMRYNIFSNTIITKEKIREHYIYIAEKKDVAFYAPRKVLDVYMINIILDN